MSSPPTLRVLVVDDSATNRRNLTEILEACADVIVVGRAADGEEALRMASQLKPDLITLDLEMPKMDGFVFLRILMSQRPTPVLVVSGYARKENVFKALELGAVDFVAKPERSGGVDATMRREIQQKVQMIRQFRPALSRAAPAPPPTRPAPEPASARSVTVPRHVVAIASSTGGPSALSDFFTRLPERFNAVVLVAQHMPEKFTRSFAERLDRCGSMKVTEAGDGDRALARHAYVCPGGLCMELTSEREGQGLLGELRLRVLPPNPSDRYIPSADRLFETVAQIAGSRAIGIVLTGMGDDGLAGARAIRAAGGIIVAESAETAVVYGMPAMVARANLANTVLPLHAIAEHLATLV